MLARRVKTGDLPAVTKRLPRNPLVVDPVDRVGVYGGTWKTVLLGASDTPWLDRTIGYEPLMRWGPLWTKVTPNVAASVDATSDAREFTINLRPGTRWSDGQPLTADDILFAYNDVLRNEELTPVLPTFLVSGDKPVHVEKVDDHTVRLTFMRSNGLFMTQLARPYEGSVLISYPRHYLEKFHPKYNKAAGKDAKRQNFNGWTDLFFSKADVWGNTELPRVHAWTVTTELGKGSRVVAERNPYYFKTDPDGSQLPYLDQVVYDVISDAQVILLKATNGELGFHTRHINTLANKPVLARGREKGHYHFISLKNSLMNDMVITFNLNHDDPVLRQVFRNRDFRIGLSYAINRTEMQRAVWQRQGEPWQAAPLPESEFYDEEFAKQYTEYSVDKASKYLDRAGYRDRDEDGYRLRPDGRRISFQVDVATPALIPFWTDAMTLVVAYWKAVGIEARVKTEDRSLYEERLRANKHDANVWTGPGGLHDEMLRTYYYFPSNIGDQTWAPLWAEWFQSRGANGEKPAPAPLEQMRLYWKLLEEPTEAGRKDLFRQLLRIAKEQFYAIGTIRVPENYGIVRDDFHNVPKVIPDSADFDTPAPTNPALYFIVAPR